MKRTVNGRASICHWALSASFLTKDQAVRAVAKILALHIDVPVAYSVYWSDTREHHVLTIEDMPWADNLMMVAGILQSVDWRDEDAEDNSLNAISKPSQTTGA